MGVMVRRERSCAGVLRMEPGDRQQQHLRAIASRKRLASDHEQHCREPQCEQAARHALGKVTFSGSVAATTTTSADDPLKHATNIADMSVAELAAKLRPRRLVGEFEYELAEPDFLLAEKIMKARETIAPDTDPHGPLQENQQNGTSVQLGLGPRVISFPDDRTQTPNAAISPASAYGWVSVTGCTATLIGPSTAISAAHCFYGPGGWITSGAISFGANNIGGVQSTPYGSYYADSLTLPGGWISAPYSHSVWDFAVLEFSPTRYPGYSTGWVGTSQSTTGYQTMFGYHGDKPSMSQWFDGGYYTSGSATGTNAFYAFDLDTTFHNMGACLINTSNRCTSIFMYEDLLTLTFKSVSRRWDSTTYNFFDTYGNWP